MAIKNIGIGTSGWSYPSGHGTWNGIFYPPRGQGQRPPEFDEVAYYAEHFDTVEVNSTFYNIPTPQITCRWAQRTPYDFEFSVKLYQEFIHPRMFADATGHDDARVDGSDVDMVRAALDPLRNADKLGVLLAQFPPSFKNDRSAHDYLAWLLSAFGDCRLPSSCGTAAGAMTWEEPSSY